MAGRLPLTLELTEAPAVDVMNLRVPRSLYRLSVAIMILVVAAALAACGDSGPTAIEYASGGGTTLLPKEAPDSAVEALRNVTTRDLGFMTA